MRVLPDGSGASSCRDRRFLLSTRGASCRIGAVVPRCMATGPRPGSAPGRQDGVPPGSCRIGAGGSRPETRSSAGMEGRPVGWGRVLPQVTGRQDGILPDRGDGASGGCPGGRHPVGLGRPRRTAAQPVGSILPDGGAGGLGLGRHPVDSGREPWRGVPAADNPVISGRAEASPRPHGLCILSFRGGGHRGRGGEAVASLASCRIGAAGTRVVRPSCRLGAAAGRSSCRLGAARSRRCSRETSGLGRWTVSGKRGR